MKKAILLILIAFIGCSEYSEPINNYELTTPEWLHGSWINETTGDIWSVHPSRIYRNEIEILGYQMDGKDYDSDNGYFIEFPRENYFDNYYSGGNEHDKIRLVFGNVNGIESIYRVLNGDVEVYTDSIINKYNRLW